MEKKRCVNRRPDSPNVGEVGYFTPQVVASPSFAKAGWVVEELPTELSKAELWAGLTSDNNLATVPDDLPVQTIPMNDNKPESDKVVVEFHVNMDNPVEPVITKTVDITEISDKALAKVEPKKKRAYTKGGAKKSKKLK